MQLDKTEIEIRQRSTVELLDLSLMVIRRYWWQLACSSALLGLPLLILNVFLTSWMLGEQGRFAMADLEDPDVAQQNRYLLHFFALYYLQFPLVSLPATVLIGNQIFFEHLNFRQLLRELRPVAWRATWVLGFLRMGLVAIPIELMIDRSGTFDGFLEVFLLVCVCCGVATIRRSVAPFAPEILGLESCKLRTRKKNELSYSRRSRSLHGPLIGDNIGRFMTCAMVVSMLVAMLYSMTFVGDFVGLRRSKVELFNSILSNSVLIQIVLPLAMWLAGIYATVFRFLSYLDSRIRLEGWEVELQLKAERVRLLQSMSIETGSDAEQAPPGANNALPPMKIQGLTPTTAATAVVDSTPLTRSLLIGLALAGCLTASTGCYSKRITSSSNANAVQAAKDRAVESIGKQAWYDPETKSYRAPLPEEVIDDPIRTNGRVAPPPAPAPAPGTTTTTPWWTPGNIDLSFLVWTILGALLIALAVLLVFKSTAVWRNKKKGILITQEIQIDPARVVDLPFEAQVEMQDPLAYAKQLLSAGDYDAAVLFLYGYMLLGLDRAGKITLHRGKTNRMYLFELSSERRLRDLLVPAMLAFEDVFFGRHSISQSRFMELWGNLNEFHRLLNPVIEANTVAEESLAREGATP